MDKTASQKSTKKSDTSKLPNINNGNSRSISDNSQKSSKENRKLKREKQQKQKTKGKAVVYEEIEYIDSNIQKDVEILQKRRASGTKYDILPALGMQFNQDNQEVSELEFWLTPENLFSVQKLWKSVRKSYIPGPKVTLKK